MPTSPRIEYESASESPSNSVRDSLEGIVLCGKTVKMTLFLQASQSSRNAKSFSAHWFQRMNFHINAGRIRDMLGFRENLNSCLLD
jgi:hypothetical protein